MQLQSLDSVGLIASQPRRAPLPDCHRGVRAVCPAGFSDTELPPGKITPWLFAKATAWVYATVVDLRHRIRN